jgi:3'-phosphoadenosine 5'-phosphosulfate sulfotransferase (PAPS reductase)/FAD synthetase
LKARPVQGFLATLDNPVNPIGVRAQESHKRAGFPAWEWSDDYDCYVYRPIKWWTKQDRIDIHQRHGLAPNPLYLQGQGAGRVGCGLCVNSGKDDLWWVSNEHPDFIGIVSELEDMLASFETPRERKLKDVVGKAGNAAWGASPQWFTLSINGENVMVPIAEAVRWANTAPGGRQQMLFRPLRDEGCSAWGLCEAVTSTKRSSR